MTSRTEQPWRSRELLERTLPHDLDVERRVLGALILGHHKPAARHVYSVLHVDDFYLGDGELHGWLFTQMWWANNKHSKPLAEIFGHVSSAKWKRLKVEIARMCDGRGKVEHLKRYVSHLQYVREWRERILECERQYAEVWEEFDDEGLVTNRDAEWRGDLRTRREYVAAWRATDEATRRSQS